MPSGILGRNDLAATTNTAVYTVPSSKVSAVNLSITNRSANTVFVRVALSNSSSPANADYIEYDSPIPPSGILERTGLVLDAAKVLVVYSSATSVSSVAYGFEENE